MAQDRVLKLIDANLNRALEGVRVIEDISRFILQDKKVSSSLKEARHKIKCAVKNIFPDPVQLLRARDVGRDVGATVSLKDELERGGVAEIAEAGFRRIQEALRVLEEFGKLFDRRAGIVFKKIRFGIYSLEKKFFLEGNVVSRGRRLSGPYVIIDSSLCPGKTYAGMAGEIIKGGGRIIQLREKKLSDRDLVKAAGEIKKVTGPAGAVFIINDRADICLAAGCDGVHLGGQDMPVLKVRKMLGRDKIIGLSTHSLKEAAGAAQLPVDYIAIGPIFHTRIKPQLRPLGVGVISKIKKKIDVPLFAIGGINSGNAAGVKKAGADGIVVISAVMGADSIARAVRQLKRSIGS